MGDNPVDCSPDRLHRGAADAKPVLTGRDPRQAGPTTISDRAAPCPLDHVNRQFIAPRPNVLWVSDFTYVSTWTGFVYVAFVIATYARRIVGWRVSRTAHAGFVLDALEQVLHERRPLNGGGLVHHSDRGSQYLSILYTERRVATRSAWRKRASSPWLVVLATAMTTRSRRPSTGSPRPRSSIGVGLGRALMPSNWQPWNGWTGSTIATAGADRKDPSR